MFFLLTSGTVRGLYYPGLLYSWNDPFARNFLVKDPLEKIGVGGLLVGISYGVGYCWRFGTVP